MRPCSRPRRLTGLALPGAAAAARLPTPAGCPAWDTRPLDKPSPLGGSTDESPARTGYHARAIRQDEPRHDLPHRR
jgi:hypothetical protein